jgi:hypothetical protein
LNDGLQITPWHPVLHNGSWKFPAHIGDSHLIRCPIVYNLVLDSLHIVTVNGVDAICLGHNYEEGILKHEYFGSQRVVNDLKMFPGWESGEVEIRNAGVQRKGGKNKYSFEDGDQMISGITLNA